MAAFHIEKNTIEGVIEWYEDKEYNNWFIYHNKPENIFDVYKGNDKEESILKLHQVLTQIKNDNNKNCYILKLFPKTKTDKEATPRVSFCLFEDNKNFIGNFPAVQYPIQPANNEILSRLAAIESKLDDYEEEEEEQLTPGSILAGLLKKPEVINGITNFVMNIAGNLATPKIKAVAGINDDNLNEIIKTLFSKGVKVEHLKKLSEMSESKIQMLISML